MNPTATRVWRMAAVASADTTASTSSMAWRLPRIKFLGPRHLLWAADKHDAPKPPQPHPLHAFYGPTVDIKEAPTTPRSAAKAPAAANTTSTSSYRVQAVGGVYDSRSAMPAPYQYATISAAEMEAIEVDQRRTILCEAMNVTRNALQCTSPLKLGYGH